MIVLLDENFPLGLLRSLQTDGLSAQHIITLGWRGASDARIRERLQDDGMRRFSLSFAVAPGMPIWQVSQFTL